VAHPDGLNHPTSFLATVSVCWADSRGRLRMVQTSRVLGDR
jgi:hypothetical protein